MKAVEVPPTRWDGPTWYPGNRRERIIWLAGGRGADRIPSDRHQAARTGSSCLQARSRLIRSLIKLRRGEYDLLVVHATRMRPGIHARSSRRCATGTSVRRSACSPFRLAVRPSVSRHPDRRRRPRRSVPVGRHNFFLLDRCRAFFKRELPSDHWLAFCKCLAIRTFPAAAGAAKGAISRRVDKLKPISLGSRAAMQRRGCAARRQDVRTFFSPARRPPTAPRAPPGVRELQALAQEGYVVDTPAKRLARPEFLAHGRAWLAWSPGGLWLGLRAALRSAAGGRPCRLINDPTILGIGRSPWRALRVLSHRTGGLAEAARQALADKPRLRRMAQAAAEHVRMHHSLHARAEYMTATVLGRRLDGSRVEPGELSSDAPALAPILVQE